MNVLLTGASGFVGKHILGALREKNCKIYLVLRVGADFDENSVDGIYWTEDVFLESVEWWQNVCSGIDLVIHSAWYVNGKDYLLSENNINCLQGTLSLANGAVVAGVKKFLGIGTCLEYDVSYGILGVETPLMPKTIYASSKVAAYYLLRDIFALHSIDFCWARLFYLYGEGEPSSKLVSYVENKIRNNEIVELSSGNQIRDYMDVRKAASSIVEAGFSKKCGAINICSGIPVTVRQVAETVADKYGRRDLLCFGSKPVGAFDPPCVVGRI